MSFTIQWVDFVSGIETREALHLPFGTLVVTRQAEVITDITWAQSAAADSSQTTLPTETGLIHPWLDPQATVTVTLLRQGSAYRNQVWAELCNIPYGKTLTYAELAKNIGSAPRAVGNACRDNPYPLVIPCHRVVSVSGMGGYCGQTTGDFMMIKSELLRFETFNHQ